MAVEESAAHSLSPAQSPLPPSDKDFRVGFRLKVAFRGVLPSWLLGPLMLCAHRIIHGGGGGGAMFSVAFRRSKQSTLWYVGYCISLSHDLTTHTPRARRR